MIFECVVFTQAELSDAAERGMRVIALCDNEFLLPAVPGIKYTAIGQVKASIGISKALAREYGIGFFGFEPEFAEEFAFVKWRDESLSLGAMPGSGSWMSSYSSYIGSYFGSFFYSSFHGSFFYEYEYEYEYGISSGIYLSSFYGGSYNLSSYISSYTGLYLSSYRDPYAHVINPFVLVNGYGIDLI